MKSLDLNTYGVVEMNQRELVETDGGFIWFVVAAIVIGLTASSCDQKEINLIKVEVKDNTVNINSSDSTATTKTNSK
jgi:lactobin A/cerein 7B family class IIb bacteriocin